MGFYSSMSEQMSAAENAELEAACFELARTTKWARKPVDSDEICALAARFTEIAKSHILYGEELCIDAPVITRAIRYLTQAHAIPPMDDDTRWFSDMLAALIEVARPNAGLDERGQAFLKDMLEGIRSRLAL